MPDEIIETVSLSEIRVTYFQSSDCCQTTYDGQHITFVGENNGVGWFYYIKTARWAVNDKSEIEKLFADFESRLLTAQNNDDILGDRKCLKE